ncbi:hypothetical protein B0H17DRAFT_1211478 [Mycena rosella]|uniref:DUF6534 domain-containing protein n=1 Tax=Mycena rosella TaxID=1033263 RepID=A0AAD7G6A1_MYCRO|nr:hypothetical protein B0H17DRAFT_1211478 [Mycena rosella]
MSANAATPTAAAAPSFAQLFGPVFWGFCVALILCGVSALQGYLYFTRYNDKLPVRLLAAMMLTLDFLSMALISQSMYYYMLPDFGSFAPLGAVTNELVVECLISAVITFTSQMYFAYQLYMVKSPGRTAIAMNAFVIVCGTVGFGGAIGCVGLMFIHPHSIFMNRNHTFAILAGLAKGFDAAADIVATIAMCMFLKSADTGITRTSSLLRSLMNLVINRGLLVTAAQIILLITFFASAGHLYWLAVHINTTKLYVNTFFGMLNARTALQDKYATGHMSLSTDHSITANSNANARRRSAAFNMVDNKVRPEFTHVGFPRKKADGMDMQAALGSQDYALGEIRVTTSSMVSDI